MEINNCSCGKMHICAVERIESGKGVLKKLNGLIPNNQGVIAVADINTYAAFRAAGGELASNVKTLVFEDKHLVPDESAIQRINEAVEDAKTIIGIGGGTINDLCKHIAHTRGLYYIYVASAPSMDGYASDGAALILSGMKVTLKSIPPHCIVCDEDLLKNSPLELIKAGVGDILGKFSCLNDWKLAAYIKGEYFCEEIYSRVMAHTKTVAENANRILQRDGEAVMLLTDALTQVGVEMSYAGSSRPASGSEHHMAHFFEIYALEHGKRHLPHGTDVGFSAYYTALLRKALINSNAPFTFAHDCKTYESVVRSVLPEAADEILALQAKTALHGNRAGNYDMQRIKQILSEAPTAEEMETMLADAGYNNEDFVSFYGKELIKTAMKYGKELKDRFTVLWLYEYKGWETLEI